MEASVSVPVGEKPCAAWVQFGDEDQGGIERLLDFASASYARHTEWFLKHRDRALVELGALVTAEMAIPKLVEANFSASALVPLYLVFMLLAAVFGVAGIIGCRQSYAAAVESIALVNKAIWAMGFAGRLTLKKDPQMMTKKLMLPDDTIFIPLRWAEMDKARSTEELKERKLGSKSKNRSRTTKQPAYFNAISLIKWPFFGAIGVFWPPRKNTCYLATFSIGILAMSGFVIGCILALKTAGIIK